MNSKIRNFIIQKFPTSKKKLFSDDTPLLESGIIDSLGILDVVAFLESSFKIRISDDELTPENFASLNCMTSFVESKMGQDEVTASHD